MAKPSLMLLSALRGTIEKLRDTPYYQWGHMGSCNCGFLAQQITRQSREEIHRRAMSGNGDWSEQLNDYCPSSQLPMAEMISALIATGFDIDDLQHLERLSDPGVLQRVPAATLRFNVREDVIRYYEAWARLIEDELLRPIELPAFFDAGRLKEKAEPEVKQGSFH